jgi:hypothetical protein
MSESGCPGHWHLQDSRCEHLRVLYPGDSPISTRELYPDIIVLPEIQLGVTPYIGSRASRSGTRMDLHSLKRLSGSTGKEAYVRMEKMLFRRKGVSNPGPEQQTAYILQNQLTAGESARRTSMVNANERISDVALYVFEL